MKKMIAFILTLAAVFSLAACGSGTAEVVTVPTETPAAEVTPTAETPAGGCKKGIAADLIILIVIGIDAAIRVANQVESAVPGLKSALAAQTTDISSCMSISMW